MDLKLEVNIEKDFRNLSILKVFKILLDKSYIKNYKVDYVQFYSFVTNNLFKNEYIKMKFADNIFRDT